MSNQWFRLYAETLNDPKVQTLSGDLFKIWINTLCVACNNNGTLPKLEDVSFALRLPLHETKTAFHELEKYALLVTVNETFQVKSWKKRQYNSDNSSERVRRYRNAKRNVTVTPPDTDTDTDTESKKKTYKKELFDDFETFWQLFPRQRRGGRESAERAYQKAVLRSPPNEIIAGLTVYAESDEVKRGFAKGATAWLNDDRWKNDYSHKVTPQSKSEGDYFEKQKNWQ